MGRKWDRARVITVINEYGQPPVIEYAEERITVDASGAKISAEGRGSLTVTYAANSPFPLIHPETGVTLGTATDDQLAMMLYSKYIADRAAEDARLAAIAAANVPHGDGASIEPAVAVTP